MEKERGRGEPPRSLFSAKDHTHMPAVAVHAPASSGSSPSRAPPGSHSSVLQVSREGLKLSPPSSTKPGGDPSLTTDVLKKQAPVETHLWIAPANKRKRASPGGGTGAGGGGEPARIPPQSPVRPVEWWRRPPSPLLVHVRPLWQSSSGGSNSGSDLSSLAALPRARNHRARARASPPSEGEAAAGGEANLKLDTSRVRVLLLCVVGRLFTLYSSHLLST